MLLLPRLNCIAVLTRCRRRIRVQPHLVSQELLILNKLLLAVLIEGSDLFAFFVVLCEHVRHEICVRISVLDFAHFLLVHLGLQNRIELLVFSSGLILLADVLNTRCLVLIDALLNVFLLLLEL